MLCGYQLNKIKFDFENFITQLKDAGADVEFVFKKMLTYDEDFSNRRLRDYNSGCGIIKTISKQKDFEKLQKSYKGPGSFPYNPMILVALIQSAAKFGAINGCNSLKGKPTVQQTALAKEKDAAFLMGLDTYYFLLPGTWTIWCDSELDMEEMTIRQLDPNVVMAHFQLKPEQAPLFACFIGDLQSSKRVNDKVLAHFGTKSLFMNAAHFVRRLEPSPPDEMLHAAILKILGMKFNSAIIDDFKNVIKSFEIDNTKTSKVDQAILDLVKDDFLSISEEILFNMPIFINPSFLNMQKRDMKPLNDLVMPLIEKTTGILMKNIEDNEPRRVLWLPEFGEFEEKQIQIISPPFEVPSFKSLIAGELSMMEKMRMLSWITDIELSDFELPVIPQEYIADSLILLYLMKHNSLTLFDSRCILKTLVDARRRDIPLQCSTDYPTVINERAFRCSFLYSKMYFIFQSCLSSLGMKYLCPEIQFDGVYFQKVYNLNKDDEGNNAEPKETSNNEEENAKTDENENSGEGEELDVSDFSQSEFIDEFARIIRM